MKRRNFVVTLGSLLLSPEIAKAQSVIFPGPGNSFQAGGGGGGGTSTLALDGSEVHNLGSFGTSNSGVSITTAGTNRLLVCGLMLDGSAIPTSVTVKGSSLGAFTLMSSQASIGWGAFTYVFMKWAPSQVTSETINATWVTSEVSYMSCIALSGSKDMTTLAAGIGFGASTASIAGGAVNVSLVTKQSNSWTFGAVAQDTTVGATYTALTSNAIYSQDVTGGNGEVSLHRSDQPLAVGTYTVGVSSAGTSNASITAVEILVGP